MPREILTIEDDTSEDAEPITGEFVPRNEELFTHPRLTVTANGYHVRIEGNVRLSLYAARTLTRSLHAHLAEHGHGV